VRSSLVDERRSRGGPALRDLLLGFRRRGLEAQFRVVAQASRDVLRLHRLPDRGVDRVGALRVVADLDVEEEPRVEREPERFPRARDEPPLEKLAVVLPLGARAVHQLVKQNLDHVVRVRVRERDHQSVSPRPSADSCAPRGRAELQLRQRSLGSHRLEVPEHLRERREVDPAEEALARELGVVADEVH
jgi:hypothetical protein